MGHIKTDATGKGYGKQGKTPPHTKPSVPGPKASGSKDSGGKGGY